MFYVLSTENRFHFLVYSADENEYDFENNTSKKQSLLQRAKTARNLFAKKNESNKKKCWVVKFEEVKINLFFFLLFGFTMKKIQLILM